MRASGASRPRSSRLRPCRSAAYACPGVTRERGDRLDGGEMVLGDGVVGRRPRQRIDVPTGSGGACARSRRRHRSACARCARPAPGRGRPPPPGAWCEITHAARRLSSRAAASAVRHRPSGTVAGGRPRGWGAARDALAAAAGGRDADTHEPSVVARAAIPASRPSLFRHRRARRPPRALRRCLRRARASLLRTETVEAARRGRGNVARDIMAREAGNGVIPRSGRRGG